MLTLRIGNRRGYSFRIKPRVELRSQRRIGPHVIEGELDSFARLAVMRGRSPKYELLIIEPGSDTNEIVSREPDAPDDRHGFYVKGQFRIVTRLGGRKAIETFSSLST